MTKRSVSRPTAETDERQLVFIAEKLQAVVGALEAAHAQSWEPFMSVPSGVTEDKLKERLQDALFDQAVALADELCAGLTARLAADDRKVA